MTETAIERPDYAAVKRAQQATWASGDYSAIGATLQITGELLCEAVGLRAGERVLDVAAGNGNAALAAARRRAEVVALDYVPELLARAQARAAADGLALEVREGDAELLPFADASFDVALSTFGVMFSPAQEQAAAELLRVCRSGGRVGLACWTPEGFVGQMLRLVGAYAPPPAGVRPPTQWGSEARLRELFAGAAGVSAQRRTYTFSYRSPEEWLHVFRSYYGPMLKAFGRVDAAQQEALAADLLALARRLNTAGPAAMSVPGEYLEVVVTV